MIIYGQHDLVEHNCVIMIGWVGYVLHLYIECPHINIREVYMLILRCFFISNHDWWLELAAISCDHFTIQSYTYNGYVYDYVWGIDT